MKKKTDNRHGQHREGLLQFGGMVEPEFKAVAMLAASARQMTLVELMKRGIEDIATSEGILENGKVSAAYREAVAAIADRLISKLNTKRGK